MLSALPAADKSLPESGQEHTRPWFLTGTMDNRFSRLSYGQKAKANLEKLKLEVKPGEKPALLSNATFAVSSNFSGICSASRGARVLEAHGFGCQFRHVHLSASHVFLSG